MKATAIPFAVVLLTVSYTSSAHHSTATFDMETDVEIRGIITKYEWINPHVYLWVESISNTGETITWQVEGGPPAMLRRSGISRDQIAVGDEVTIYAKPHRDVEKREVLMNSLAKEDSQKLNFGQADAMASIINTNEVVPVTATSMAGTWGTLLDLAAIGPIVNPPEAVLTERGKQDRAAIRAGNLPDNPPCTPNVAPTIMVAPDIKLIEVDENEVRLSREWDGVVRTVDMKTTSHDGVPASLQGHSIGHWESDVLIIDTARFTANPRGNGYTLPSGEQKHIIEKLRLNEAKTHLLYSFVLEDPEYLVEPVVSLELQWTYRPDMEFVPLACDSANAIRHTQ